MLTFAAICAATETIAEMVEMVRERAKTRKLKPEEYQGGTSAVSNLGMFGIKSFDALPANARSYLKRIEEICEVPVDMISTGPDRTETILLRHPFE